MITTPVDTRSGALTYWSLGSETDPDKLMPRLRSLGLPNYAPDPRTWLMSLKAALAEHFDHPTQLVRPLKSRIKEGYTVVKEMRGESVNDYPRIANAKIDGEGHVTITYGDVSAYEIQLRANHFRRVLPGSSVSSMLVAIVCEEMGGITLRRGGGIYYVPEEHVERWTSVCQAVEQSAVGASANAMTLMPFEKNEMSIRDIRSAIINEIESCSAHIRNELAENDLGAVAIENRIDSSHRMMNRMKSYEKLLGETLTSCRSALAGTLQALSAATAVQQTDNTFTDMYAEAS